MNWSLKEIAAGSVVIGAIALMVWTNHLDSNDQGQTEAVASPAGVDAVSPNQLATQQECESRWIRVEQAGIILGTRSEGGVPQVVVDEATFASVNYPTKVGYAETLNCAAFADGRQFALIEFRSDRTNRRLARWTPGSGLTVD